MHARHSSALLFISGDLTSLVHQGKEEDKHRRDWNRSVQVIRGRKTCMSNIADVPDM